MARCGDCNKFVSFEEQDPEVEDVEYDSGEIRVTARIVNACADCGSELREASLDMSAEAPEGWDAHDPDELRKANPDMSEEEIEKHEIEVEEESSERTSRQDGKPGTPSRYRRTYYGAKVTVAVSCACGWKPEAVELEDEVMASGMDEL